jgi:hypothetical protein
VRSWRATRHRDGKTSGNGVFDQLSQQIDAFSGEIRPVSRWSSMHREFWLGAIRSLAPPPGSHGASSSVSLLLPNR